MKKFKYLSRFTDIKQLKIYADETDDIELKGAIRNAERFKGYLFVLYGKAKQKNSSTSKNKLTTAHKSKGLE